MKAAVKTEPKPGIDLIEVDDPSPKSNQILLEVKAASICGSDVHIYEWTKGYEWMPLPLIIGHEFSGRIVECGRDVKGLQEGERVVCIPIVPCGRCAPCKNGRINICENIQGIGFHINGAFAKYVLVPRNIAGIFPIPKHISYEIGALCEPLSVALHAIETSQIRFGESSVVIGPGPIGLLITQCLKAMGVTKVFVTGLEMDKERLRLAEKFGAESINIEEEDPIKVVKSSMGGKGTDVVFEASGNPAALSQAINMVKKGGEIVVVGIFSKPSVIQFTPIVRCEIRIKGSYGYTFQTWKRALSLLSVGKLNIEPLITHILPLDKIVDGLKLMKEKLAIKVILKP